MNDLGAKRFRAATPSNPASWDMAKAETLARSAVAGRVLADMADTDPRIFVLTADLKFSNLTVEFEKRHPGRFVNVGIAEQHMVSMAAGMSTFGKRPYIATFASFVGLLALEQIRTDLAYPSLPVRVLAHHAGISLGFYGTSHHATEDLSALRSIAGLTIVCPCDATATQMTLVQTVDTSGPVYFRLGRGRETDVYPIDGVSYCVGTIAVLREGRDACIVANGITVSSAMQAAEVLSNEGINVAVLDAHTMRPFDAETFCEYAAACGKVLVAEEHNIYGGVASACADALVDCGMSGVKLHRLGMPPDDYALIGPPTHLYRHYGLDADGIESAMRRLLAI